MKDQLDDLLNGFKNGSMIDYETISSPLEMFYIWKGENDLQKQESIKARLLTMVSEIPTNESGFETISNLWQRVNTWSHSCAMGVFQQGNLDQKSIFMNQLILDKYGEILSTIPDTKEGFKSLRSYSIYIQDGFDTLPDVVKPYHDKTVAILPLILPDENNLLSLSCLLHDGNVKNNERAIKLIDQRAVEIINKEFPKINNFWVIDRDFWHYRLPGNSSSRGLMLEKMDQIFRNTPKTISGFEELGSFYQLAQFHNEIWSLLSQVMIERLPLILPLIQDLKVIIPYSGFVRVGSIPFEMLLKREYEILSLMSDFEKLMTCIRMGGEWRVIKAIEERIAELLVGVTRDNFPDSLKRVLQWNLREDERELFLPTINGL